MPSPSRSRRAATSARPGDILLFYRATGLNRLITWFSGSPFFHVEIYEGDNWAIGARPQGVVRSRIGDGQVSREHVVIPAPEGRGEVALQWAKSELGDRYDVLGVGMLIFDRLLDQTLSRLQIDYSHRDAYSCGEFVARAFAHAGVDLFPGRDASAVAPWDFALLLPSKTVRHFARFMGAWRTKKMMAHLPSG